MTSSSIAVSIYRGGTSRGVFVKADDLARFQDRDATVRRLLGSPNPAQVDGLGGAQAVTSKCVVVSAARDPGCDVEYQVAQVGIDDEVVDWNGTCGNLTSAVGPYAIDQALVRLQTQDGPVELALRNLSTGDAIRVAFEVANGTFNPEGDTIIDGVAGTGSAIQCDYLDPAGGTLGSLYPLSEPTDCITFRGEPVDITVVDVTHPNVFVDGRLFHREAALPYQALRKLDTLQETLESLRLAVCDLLDVKPEQRSSVPRIIACYPDDAADLRVLALSGGRFIPSVPVSGALALAAACRLDGTVPNRLASAATGSRTRIAHPAGVIEVSARFGSDGTVQSVGLIRTARRIMAGEAFV